MKLIRRSFLLIYLLILSLSLSSCAQKSVVVEEKLEANGSLNAKEVSNEKPEELTPAAAANETFTYDLDSAQINEENIHVRYPVIIEANDKEKENEINKMIAQDITNLVAAQLSNVSEKGALSLELDYTISGYFDKVLSIAYVGTSYIKEGLYPVNIYHTLNIDLNQGKKLAPTDLFVINEDLVNEFKMGAYFPYIEDLDLTKSGMSLKEIIEGQYSDEALLSLFQSQEVNFTLTDFEVVLSIEIPHVMGDHLEIGIPFESLKSNMKDSTIWKVN